MIESHTSPRFNANGNQIINSQFEPVKDPWPNQPQIKTHTELKSKRKLDLLPDPSFDLDKDGYVGHLDLFLSKQFDKDKDGKLNKLERETAENAIKSGYLSNFKFGLDSIGPNTNLRTIQKRGVIVENDDLEKLKETYPIIRHTSLPSFTSRTQMINFRKTGQQTSRPFENVFRIEVTQPIQDSSKKEPKFTSAEAIKAAYRNSIREKMGMTEPKDLKIESSPSLNYMSQPSYPSQSSMNQEKRKELLKNLHNNANYNHINREKHLLEREKLLISHKEGKTYAEIKEKMRLETNEYNQKVFSNITIGVHGKELPKFSDNQKEFWKSRQDYVENPTTLTKTVSSPLITKLHAPAEGTSNGINPLKKKTSPDDIADKPNHIIPYGGYIPVEITDTSYKVPHIKYRMSTIFGHFLESAAEMGINFLPVSENPRTEKLKNHGLETSVASEIPKTSHSIVKKQTARTVISSNPLRTTGFNIKKPIEE